eukprot:s14_g15.t1
MQVIFLVGANQAWFGTYDTHESGPEIEKDQPLAQVSLDLRPMRRIWWRSLARDRAFKVTCNMTSTCFPPDAARAQPRFRRPKLTTSTISSSRMRQRSAARVFAAMRQRCEFR